MYRETSSETGSLDDFYRAENMFLSFEGKESKVRCFLFPDKLIVSFLAPAVAVRGTPVRSLTFAVFGANRRCIIPAPSIHLSRRFVAMSCAAVHGFEAPSGFAQCDVDP